MMRDGIASEKEEWICFLNLYIAMESFALRKCGGTEKSATAWWDPGVRIVVSFGGLAAMGGCAGSAIPGIWKNMSSVMRENFSFTTWKRSIFPSSLFTGLKFMEIRAF
jgi:hypothetical protein